MKMILGWSFLVLLFVSGVAGKDVKALVRFDDIDGSSGFAPFDKWSELKGWSWDFHEGDVWARAEVRKVVDRASPEVWRRLVEGEILPRVTMLFFEENEPRWMLRLRGVQLTAAEVAGDGMGGEVCETIRFRFLRMAQGFLVPGEEPVGVEGEFEGQVCALFDLREEDNDLDFLENGDDPDDDNDGLEDVLEEEAGLDPLVADANEDADGDGQANGAEAIAGTDVFDAGSRWQVSRIDKMGTMTKVSWVARAGRTYRVYSSGDLKSGQWKEYTSGPVPTGDGEVVSVDVPVSGGSQFFRVAVKVP